MSSRITILIPVFNHLEYTQRCLECLRADSYKGIRIIVVDNGSTDGTRDWLRGQCGLELILNDANLGCAPAWNQGARSAGVLAVEGTTGECASEWLVILNNDVLLPANWLDGLIASAKSRHLDVVSPALREREMNYCFPDYSKEFMGRMNGVIRRGAAHGVCFAVCAEVFSRIGGFDESFKIGQFEDGDFFRRARLAGFKLGIVGGSFIHHYGSVTQDSMSERSGERPYEAANRAYFRKKWKLGWFKRRVEKAARSFRLFYWRASERLLFGHTLHEKWVNGRLKYL
jgi:N-acetylglucosaminyl-diphospho-decaprenol L-rhamnosyltransferase